MIILDTLSMPTKVCARSFHVGPRELPIIEFNKDVTRPGGTQRYCRTCQQKYARDRMNVRKHQVRTKAPYFNPEAPVAVLSDARKLVALVRESEKNRGFAIYFAGRGEKVKAQRFWAQHYRVEKRIEQQITYMEQLNDRSIKEAKESVERLTQNVADVPLR